MAFGGDPCPNLSLAIDIAGDKYYLGAERPVELGYKSQKDFFLAFGDDPETQCLLRKYMPIGNDVLKTVFDSEDDRNQIIRVLELRAQSLKASNQFNSSVLKNTVIQRFYVNLINLIEGLKGEPYQPKEWGKGLKGVIKGIKPSVFTPTSSYIAYAKALTDDQKIQLILEMSWFLLHPDQVPEKAQRRWFKMVKRLDTLRLDDFAGLSEKIKTLIEKNPGKPFLNYFKNLNLASVMDLKEKKDLQFLSSDVLGKVFDNACDRDKAILEERMRIILQLLRAKEYLTDTDISDLSDLTSQTSEDIFMGLTDSLVENPGVPRSVLLGGRQSGGRQAGGAEQKEMSSGLRASLIPFFDYFSGLYDPVYGVLDESISSAEVKPSVDELIRLFNIVSKINPENDPKKYGVYRLVGLEKSVADFVRHLIKSTEFHTDKLSDSEKNEYFEDLSVLPRVRISSVVNQFSSNYKDPSKLPFISLMLVGAGITLLSEDEIEDPIKGFIRKSMDSHGVSSANKTLSSLNFGQIHESITDYFNDSNLYIVCNSEKDKLPLNVYDIDINTIKLEDTTINGTLLENNYFNKLKIGSSSLFLDDLVTVDNENIVNEAAFALAIFISMKDLFNE